jgi:hypothetical protein
MILDVTQSTLSNIKNLNLREYADIYVKIHQDFIQQIAEKGIEIDAHDNSAQIAERIAQLRRKGAILRNGDKSIYTQAHLPFL